MQQSEFDKFADEYATTLTQVLSVSGEAPAYFAQYKVQALPRLGVQVQAAFTPVVVDFGGGVGQSSPYLGQTFPSAHIVCADVSARSLAVGRQHFADQASFVRFDGRRLPFADDSVDLVFSACVFHHIEPVYHARLFCEIARVLKPTGAFAVFEHNPLNPLTRRVVNQCPFDANAELLCASALRAALVRQGFGCQVAYHLFFPRMLRWLRL